MKDVAIRWNNATIVYGISMAFLLFLSQMDLEASVHNI